MNGAEELALHDNDRDGWLAYVAPNMARKLIGESDATLGATWARIPRDYQTAVWQHLDETQRARIRALRNA
jgi:hypothetical protein